MNDLSSYKKQYLTKQIVLKANDFNDA